MPIRRSTLSRDTIVAIRDDYAAGELTTDAICRRHGIGPGTLCFWVDGGEPDGEWHFPPLPRRRGKPDAGHQRRFSGRRGAVVRRMWRTAEAQVFEIERRLTGDLQQPDQQERDARTLALLAKTLRDLAELDDAKPDDRAAAPPDADDDAGPENIEDFRRELARRMEEIVAQQQMAVSGGAQSERDQTLE